jgi:hypothetical protein
LDVIFDVLKGGELKEGVEELDVQEYGSDFRELCTFQSAVGPRKTTLRDHKHSEVIPCDKARGTESWEASKEPVE